MNIYPNSFFPLC